MKVQSLITTTHAPKSGNGSKSFLFFSLVLILVFNLLVKLQREELMGGGFLSVHTFTTRPAPTPYLATSNLLQEGSYGVSEHKGPLWSPQSEKREGS